MKLPSEPNTNRARISHERQNINNKEDNEVSLRYKTMPMGDGPTSSNFNAPSLDSVSCWGDVPRRPVRLTDILSDVEQEPVTTSRSGISRITAGQRSTENAQLPDNQTSSPKSFQTKSNTSSENNTRSSITSTNSTSNKPPSIAGREKLLEWLRTSQAKRDENNRQVFTRWIDRIDSMNNQENTMTNLTPGAVAATGNLNALDYHNGNFYTTPQTLPGLLTTPTFFIGNPMGLMTTSSVRTNSNLSKLTTFVPASYSIKGNPLGIGPFMSNLTPHVLTVSSPANSVDSLPPGSYNASTDFLTVSPENLKPDFLSQTTTNHSNCTNTSLETYPDEKPTSVQSVTDNSTATQPVSTSCTGLTNKDQSITRSVIVPSVHSYLSQPSASNSTVSSLARSNTHGLIHALQPQPYYVTMPVINNPLCPPMFYYYCYQNQLSPGQNLLHHSPLKLSDPGQQLVYLVPTVGPNSSLSTTSQPMYVPDNCICVPAYQPIPDQSNYDLANLSTDSSAHRTFEASGYSSVTSTVPTYPGNIKDETETPSSNPAHLLSLENGAILKVNQTNNSEPLSTVPPCSVNALDFDMNQWYTILQDIGSSSNLPESSSIPTSAEVNNSNLYQTHISNSHLTETAVVADERQTGKV